MTLLRIAQALLLLAHVLAASGAGTIRGVRFSGVSTSRIGQRRLMMDKMGEKGDKVEKDKENEVDSDEEEFSPGATVAEESEDEVMASGQGMMGSGAAKGEAKTGAMGGMKVGAGSKGSTSGQKESATKSAKSQPKDAVKKQKKAKSQTMMNKLTKKGSKIQDSVDDPTIEGLSADEPAMETLVPTMMPFADETPAPTFVITTDPPREGIPASPTFTPTVPLSTDLPVENSAVSVNFTLRFGFFDGAIVFEPSQQDLDAVLDQINLFYTETFANASDDFVAFEAVVMDTDFDEEATYPVTLYMSASVLFDGPEKPAPEDVLEIMANANYQKLITDFVWEAPSVLFFDTARVFFSSSVDPDGTSYALPIAGITEGPDTQQPTMTMTVTQTEADVGTPEEIPVTTVAPQDDATDAPSHVTTDVPSILPEVEVTEDPVGMTTDAPEVLPEVEITDIPADMTTDAPVVLPEVEATDTPTGMTTDAPLEEDGVVVPEVTDAPSEEADEDLSSSSTAVPTEQDSMDSSGENNPNPVVLEATIDFGFFDDAEVNEPMPEEIDGLVVQINNFYTDVLSPGFDSFAAFEANVVNTTFTDESFGLDFDAFVFFDDGSEIPSQSEVFTVMQGADYQLFITDYASNAANTSTFYHTQTVLFKARTAM